MARKINPRKIKENSAIVVIGEGQTESYYLQSIKDLTSCTICPKLPKHSGGLKYLECKIQECIEDGYKIIFCMIDMDIHLKNIQKYQFFKVKFHNKIHRSKKQGTTSTIILIENHPCTEIWFLYHFKYTSACYMSYSQLEPELLKSLPHYKKGKDFLSSCGGLHDYITLNKGSLSQAISNSDKSIIHSTENDNTNNGYSEMSALFNKILKK